MMALPEMKAQIDKLSLLPMDTPSVAGDAEFRQVGDRALGRHRQEGGDRRVAIKIATATLGGSHDWFGSFRRRVGGGCLHSGRRRGPTIIRRVR